MIEPGKLDQRITIKRPSTERTFTGGHKYAYSDFKTVWAEIRYLKGRELVEAAQRFAEVEVKFTIRYSGEVSSVTAKDIISHNGVEYDILAALPIPGGRPEKIEILARGRAD